MKKMFCYQTISAFITDERGNIAMMTGFLLPVWLLCLGGMVDFGRAQLVRTHTHGVMDAAALSMSLTDPDNWNEEVAGLKKALSKEERKQLGKAFYEAGNGAGVPSEDQVAFNKLGINISGSTVTVENSEKINTKILFAGGAINTLNVGSKTTVAVGDPLYEIDGDFIFVLDYSGSMGFYEVGDGSGLKRIEGLKRALEAFSNRFVSDGTPPVAISPRLRVGLSLYAGKTWKEILPLKKVRDTLDDNNIPEFYRVVDNTPVPMANGRPVCLECRTCAKCGLEEALALMQSAPVRADGRKLSKHLYILLLSDGEFNEPYGPDGYDSDGDETARGAARDACNAIKTAMQGKADQNLHILTIGYSSDLVPGSPTLKVMKDCATNHPDTGEPRYYENVGSAELVNLFTSFADEVGDIRITE